MKYLNDVNYKDCVGKVCKSKSSGDFKIVKYNNARDVQIQFLNTGFETTVQLTNIRNGSTKYPSTINGVNTKEYVLWVHMLQRCYSDSFKKRRPTYEDCKCSENFKSYEYFYEWCHSQIGFDNEGWQLDKDLLIKGNKVYSADSCIFIPQEINSLLIKRTASRGEYLIGVYWDKTNKAFRARVNKNKGKQEHLGFFNTELEAFNAYKTAKESFVKEQAEKWKSHIDERAYNALMRYQVEIDD